MTLTELRYIVAVARERHFGRAADACFVSQPTLSVAIKKLEEELNVQIFERSGAEFIDLQKEQWLIEKTQQLSVALLSSYPELAEQHLSRWLGSRAEYLKA